MDVIMQNWLAIDGLSFFVIIFLGILVTGNHVLSKTFRSHFLASIVFACISILAEITVLLFGDNAWNNTIGFATTPLIPVCFVTGKIDKGYRDIVWIPALINMIISMTSPLTGWLFSLDPYHRGPFFWVFTFSYLWGICLVIIMTFKAQKVFFDVPKRFSFGTLFFLVVGTSIQMLLPQIHATWCCVTFIMLLGYLFIISIQNTYDPLTEAHNRASYQNVLEQAKVVVFLDINNFKSINDQYGHLYGDICLKHVAHMLLFCAEKQEGACYRIGGDEFCLLFKNKEGYDNVLSEFSALLQAKRKSDEKFPSVSWGIGVRKQNEDINEVIRQADEQLYRMKNHQS